MKRILFAFAMLLALQVCSQETIHVCVALCDNLNQGIVPVPSKIGNGQDPKNNLYWGCGYGVKSFFKLKSEEWELVQHRESKFKPEYILERVLFKHKTKNAYLLADAYDGAFIKECMEDVLEYGAGKHEVMVFNQDQEISFGGKAELLAYVGHNGLMDTDINVNLITPTSPKDMILLGCYTKPYFSAYLQEIDARPILWTTHLMAPEAYTLEAAVNAWLEGKSGEAIDEIAAQTYHQYQKCGMKGARNLFASGY